MRITFDFEITPDEIKNLLPKKDDNGLDNLIKEIVKTNETNNMKAESFCAAEPQKSKTVDFGPVRCPIDLSTAQIVIINGKEYMIGRKL